MSVTIVWKDSNMSKAMENFTIEAIKKAKTFEDSIKSATAIKRQLQNEYHGEWNVIIAKDIPHFGYNVKYDKGCIIQATYGGYTFLIFKSPIVL